MTASDGKYNIKAVSKMIGIQAGTLRAWERRYQIIAPVRNEAGHRLYTDDHVKVLKWLVTKINDGFTISQAVSLLESQDFNMNECSIREKNNMTDFIDSLLTEILTFNEQGARERLDHVFSLFSPEKVLLEIITPTLIKVGDLWEQGKMTTAHEHFFAAFIRSRLGMLTQSIPIYGYLPKAIAVCAPGEKHELGLLSFLIFLRRKGIECIYLGTSIKEEDYIQIIQEIKPKFVFISCTMMTNIDATLRLVELISSSFKDIFVGIGGQAVSRRKFITEDVKVGNEPTEWAKWLDHRLHIKK